ncbi:hypothetical protein [Halopiger djelfimassiliensis]|uniref:hypothetical protein n=1 Tax=Halopiger djelfimassiliensis TaxID=1293047 RepID=UPI0006779EEE|nr:hypothetical protein [Halopiger djelfimassiliensis]
MNRRSALVRRTGIVIAFVVALLSAGAGIVAASNAAVGLSGSSGNVTVPTWLYLATGGGVVGASALVTMLVTDRTIIDAFHDDAVGFPMQRLQDVGSLLLGTLGVVALVFVIAVGLVGPQIGNFSAAVLVTFVGGRALLTIGAYTIGNPWPALNPWRRIATVLPNGYARYPSWLGSWPAVAALLVLLWLEIVAPLSSSPRVLALVVLAYTVGTLAAAVVFTPETWFKRGDPISAWFRLYGAVAPIQRTADGLEFRYPGAKLSEDDIVTESATVAVVLLLVWELTYSGFIVTEPGVRTVETLVGIGFPPSLVYLGLLLAGFGLFWKVYWVAASRARDQAETYLSERYIALRFAPSLLAIAAGYHFAHYAGFAISLWPSLLDTLVAPLNPPANPTQYALTSWFGYVEIAGVLLGHVVAVWIAHTVSFELFPGKLQAIRSQYPFIIVMVFFTMVSLYLVSLPSMGALYVPD